MLELLSFGFMQRALLAALVTGLAAPAVGTYLVQRRLALIGDGLGHVAVTGVAIGLLTGTSPTWTAVIVAIAGALILELIRERGQASGDLALALLFYGGIAAGVLLTGLGDQAPARLQQYLFGSILTVSRADLFATIALAVVTLVIALGLSPQLYAVALDPEFAQVAGLRVRAYNLLVAVLAAVTVTVAMRTVGLLLVSAMMVVPVAASQQLTRSFRGTLTNAMVIGAGSALGGLLIAAYLSVRFEAQVAPGPAIVLLALAVFAVMWPIGAVVRRRNARLAPFPVVPVPSEHEAAGEHTHVHGEDCGHLAVPHGDHIDYLHDGHRHAPHGGHYDEH
jgi:zinc transport system permease protein